MDGGSGNHKMAVNIGDGDSQRCNFGASHRMYVCVKKVNIVFAAIFTVAVVLLPCAATVTDDGYANGKSEEYGCTDEPSLTESPGHENEDADQNQCVKDYCQKLDDENSQDIATDDHHEVLGAGGGYVYQYTKPSQLGNIPEWDTSGYVFFCLCMGRFGNQMDHLLGAMAFVKALNRTLVIPPLRTYRNVRFTEWFQFEEISKYHKSVLAEDFMEFLAPEHWPPGKRYGFCYLPPSHEEQICQMKNGQPFQSFWDELGVDFDKNVVHHITYRSPDAWMKSYPASKYPVIALKGAPAGYPVEAQHRQLQQYLVFSNRINQEVDQYIQKTFPNEQFVGIHLRNGRDWEVACRHISPATRDFLSSNQCTEDRDIEITKDMCLPAVSEVLRLTKNIVLKTRVNVVFVATDSNPLHKELEQHLENQKVRVYHLNPHLPIVDAAMLIRSDYFIGNCFSSFTSFVKRARDLKQMPSAFFGVE